ncbi:MAG: ParB N-terminal domain-containing protein, partial [Phycisphaerales bacterium]
MSQKKREKPKHLGRGLQSLLGPITETASAVELDAAMSSQIANYPENKELRSALREIKVDSVLPNPYQPRTAWIEEELEDLAESIRTNGVV